MQTAWGEPTILLIAPIVLSFAKNFLMQVSRHFTRTMIIIGLMIHVARRSIPVRLINAGGLPPIGKEFVFGVEPRQFSNTPKRMVMFFDVKEK